VKRAELFEKTDFKIPTLTVKAEEEDFKNFFLKYQCERDMNIRYLTRNEDCYTAPWVNLDSVMNKAMINELIRKEDLSTKDLALIEKGKLTLSDFEGIVTRNTNLTLEEILSTGYGLIKLPDYEIGEAGMSFDIEG